MLEFPLALSTAFRVIFFNGHERAPIEIPPQSFSLQSPISAIASRKRAAPSRLGLVVVAMFAAYVGWFSPASVSDGRAACAVGVEIGVCPPGMGYEGCCPTPSSVKWCEGQSLCELDCSGNVGANQNCVPTADSCCGACGGLSGSCWCDAECVNYGDCCADMGAFCNADGSPMADSNWCG